MCTWPRVRVAAVGAETVSGAIDVVVVAERLVWCGCVRRGGRGLGMVGRGIRVDPRHDEDDDQHGHRGDRRQRPADAPGPVVDGVHDPVLGAGHERRGHAAASGPASSKATGSAGFGTGGGGTGGTTTLPGSVRRTVDEPETRKALAGNGASPLPLLRAAGRRVGPDLLERVQLAVVALHGVHVVVGAAAEDHERDDTDDDHDTDDHADQHRPIFNRICGARRTAPPPGRRRPGAAAPGAVSRPGGAGCRRGCRRAAGWPGPAARGWGR